MERYEKYKDSIKLIKLSEKWNNKETDNLMKNWSQNIYKTAWRMMSFRSHWKLSFAKIRDDLWDIQLCFVRNLVVLNTGKEIVKEIKINWEIKTAYKFVDKMLDIGDYIWVSWELFVTKHWESTLFVNEVQLLSKSIRPLPEKFHWIQDQEAKYRQRYLDLIMNQDTYKRFLFKSKFYAELRNFYKENWFQEIVTSILWNSASWAAAKPFITHHNDFDEDFFLRIAFETSLKKATVWRYEKVFEIWKDFRNEWSDPSHLQEFTQVEHYAAYWNYKDNMKFCEKMFDYLFDKLWLQKKLKVKNKEWEIKEVDFTTPWKRIDYIEWVKKESWIDISKYSMKDTEKLKEDIKNKWYIFDWMDTMWLTTLIDYLYKKVLRPKIIWPAFIFNYPKTMQPLARQSDEDNNIVEQFQLLVNWWEITKAYSELVDPKLQQEKFDEQSAAVENWDEEATASDNDFVLAMEYWMPPQSWFGMWLERILAILTEQDNLRDVVLFPIMKSRHQDQEE